MIKLISLNIIHSSNCREEAVDSRKEKKIENFFCVLEIHVYLFSDAFNMLGHCNTQHIKLIRVPLLGTINVQLLTSSSSA